MGSGFNGLVVQGHGFLGYQAPQAALGVLPRRREEVCLPGVVGMLAGLLLLLLLLMYACACSTFVCTFFACGRSAKLHRFVLGRASASEKKNALTSHCMVNM